MKTFDAKTIDASTKKKLDGIIEKVDSGDLELNEFESGFIGGFREKLEKWGDKVFMSDKQKAVIDKIWEKSNGKKKSG